MKKIVQYTTDIDENSIVYIFSLNGKLIELYSEKANVLFSFLEAEGYTRKRVKYSELREHI